MIQQKDLHKKLHKNINTTLKKKTYKLSGLFQNFREDLGSTGVSFQNTELIIL